ncbi:MAG: hypothetical protein KH297_04600 [Firmicutes bacterium]|nr:hypothetical protein [Bacillota bacterium]
MIKEIARDSILEIIYLVISVVYMLFLNSFNKELLNLGIADKALEVLAYDNGKAIWFFVVAIILVILGGRGIVKHIKIIATDELEIVEFIAALLIILVLATLIWGIIALIKIPILKAVAIAACAGGAIYVAAS